MFPLNSDYTFISTKHIKGLMIEFRSFIFPACEKSASEIKKPQNTNSFGGGDISLPDSNTVQMRGEKHRKSGGES